MTLETNLLTHSAFNNPDEMYSALIAIEAELGKRNFYDFVKITFNVIEPETKFSESWHIKLLCDYAQACYEGKVRNLLVNIPPRHSKSLIFNVFFPAWVWINKPTARFLYASYGEDLAIKFSVQCRNLITSDFYQARWPMQLSKEENAKQFFSNSYGGFRASFGSHGAVTGHGGDFLIADDILNAQDKDSEDKRKGSNEWYGNTFSNRFANPKNTVRVILGQRIHQDDIFGYIKEQDKEEKWEHVILPAKYEGKRYVSSIGLDDPRIIEGEPLWPDVYGEDELKNLTANMSELEIAGQMQQRPSGIMGNIFKREWFLDKNRFFTVKKIYRRYQSWDTASSVNNTSAYSVCVTGELDDKYRLHIIDVWRDRVDFTDLTDVAEKLATRWKYNLKGIIIENKSTGQPLIDTLRKSSSGWMKSLIHPYNPGLTDKDKRCYQASMWCSKDMVLLPYPDETRGWLFDFEDELFNVPQTKYRDQTDAFSQLVLYLQLHLEDGYRAKRFYEKEVISE